MKGRVGDAKQRHAASVGKQNEKTAQPSAAKTPVLRYHPGTALTLLRRPRHLYAAVVPFSKFSETEGQGYERKRKNVV